VQLPVRLSVQDIMGCCPKYSKTLIACLIILRSVTAGFDSVSVMLHRLTYKEDSSKVGNSEIIADSAGFIQPPMYTVLGGLSCDIELKPEIRVDSAAIFVRHSNTIDTLGILTAPPYTLTWNYSEIPDNDQIHLQPGYILYLPSGLKIISPPHPHFWIINRKGTLSNRKFHSHQTTAPEEFEIDGDSREWKKIKKVSLGKNGFAKIVWTIGKLYFVAQIEDRSITVGDYLELHFDMYNDKSEFAGINHRSIRFNPRSSVRYLTYDLTGSGFIPADSVVMLQKEFVEWRTRLHDSMYTIEAAIPFFCLSDLTYPSIKSGFDITIVDVDVKSDGVTDTAFYSWASKSTLFSRYSPSRWGTLILHQAMFPLSVVMLISGLFFSVIIITLAILLISRYVKEQKIKAREERGFSDTMNRIALCIYGLIDTVDLTLPMVANQTKITEESIVNHIQSEAHCTFDYFVVTERVRRAKKLLSGKLYNITQVVTDTGFKNAGDFESAFKSITGTTPEQFHKRKVLEIEEDEG
jgi:AraC-like DNA-binding protein